MTDDLLAPVAPRLRTGFLPRSTSSLVVAQITGQGLAVVTAVMLGRRLGAAGFGVYAFATAAIFVLNVGTTLGTDMVLIREIARDRRVDRCIAALGLQIALSIAAIAAVFAVTAAVSAVASTGADRFAAPIRIFAVSLVPAAFYSVATAMLRGLGLLRVYAVLVVAAAAFPLVAVAALVRRGDSVPWSMAVLVAAQTAVAVLAIACCVAPWKAAGASAHLSRGEVVAMARTSRAIGGLGVIGVLYQRLAMFGVAVLVGPTTTGWYSGAARLVEASKTGHIALAGATYPVMAEAAARPGNHHRDAVLRTAKRTNLAMAIVLATMVIFVGPTLIDRLYGSAFASSKHAVTILAVGLVPSCVATFQSLSLFAEGREREVLRIMVVSIVVLGVGLAGFIAAFGWIGACWAMLVADSTQAILLMTRRRSRRHG
jgi:O-antigen/teichoic acid export membrane protein